MTRQRYSAKESLNRIVRLLQGSPLPSDTPDTVTGEVLSVDAALSDLAELLAGSLPSAVAYPIATRYGHMFAHNSTGTVTVAAADAYYAVSGGFKTGLMSGFTFSNGMHLKPTVDGRYFINYSVSVQSTSANQEIESAVLIDSIAHTGSSAHTEDTGANKPHALAGSVVADLAANSIVGLGVINRTGANNLMVVHGNMTIFLLAPYGG